VIKTSRSLTTLELAMNELGRDKLWNQTILQKRQTATEVASLQ
jgi:hypothetical protein